MSLHNHEYLRRFAEDRIRIYLLEADKSSKLEQLRLERQSWLSCQARGLLSHLGRSLIEMGKRLEGYEFSSTT
jgi:hypothetical protein